MYGPSWVSFMLSMRYKQPWSESTHSSRALSWSQWYVAWCDVIGQSRKCLEDGGIWTTVPALISVLDGAAKAEPVEQTVMWWVCWIDINGYLWKHFTLFQNQWAASLESNPRIHHEFRDHFFYLVEYKYSSFNTISRNGFFDSILVCRVSHTSWWKANN